MKETLLSLDRQRLDMPLIESAGWHDIVTAIPSLKRRTTAFHLTYVARQEATWLIHPDRKLFIQAGQLALIMPNSEHQGAWTVDHPNQHLWLYVQPTAPDAARHSPFSTEFLQDTARRLLARGSCVVNAPPMMQRYGEELQERLRGGTDQDYLWLRCLMGSMFLACTEVLFEEERPQDVLLQEILRTVDDRLLEWPTVAAVAEFFQMDLTAFHRLFKKTTGMSPWNYILRSRCRLGCELLRKSALSITALAHELGFSSSQHFSTVFRRLTGHTPGDFRRLYAEAS